ncbi:MAG: winged helix-turn-helix transcriptional regulator [Cyanobacteria bacterium]|nr:winged helix-turn-helix transcriptional regulator [Cyanobacteria bacterium CG_2015-16_32_12]NCO77432.1 winged helix-turn-helix transcriptional regulator [Cyanobacteria bacterium CG_2015-22_32_23]NCQ04359.1 winged helix-turn-helix transcriptional regulator [Cyanobacteria bacterium CG_2015-09_32_10]NCQ42289.1 winged helix-turn-helix transcriptional regulator [Cyanobacteria bacterium CG_2015-04_32_10]NCS83344.1 winged helix-turn-helix transcriptional regulator [Cyanobacteria bacterium CG_2015-0
MKNSSLTIEEKVNNSQECLMASMSPSALSMVADFFKVLSEVSRLNIVCCLRGGSKNVTEIIEVTGLGQANVSKHLKMLAQVGVVTRTQRGINVYYEITNPFVFQLCDVVCNSISMQIQQQHQQLSQLNLIKKNHL